MIKNLIPVKIKKYMTRFMMSYTFFNSQARQDLWVFGEAFNQMEGGYFVDIGAFDGITINNTLILEAQYKWNGICIEANPLAFEELKNNRRVTCLNVCLDKTESEVDFVLAGVDGGIVDRELRNNPSNVNNRNIIKISTRRLGDILREEKSPSIIDYLSIDIEGAEERVLGEFNFSDYLFRCITIERPSSRLRQKLKLNGYKLVKEIPNLDCFYVHNDFENEYMENLFSYYENRYVDIKFNWWKR